VHGQKVVSERVTFSDSPGYELDPSVFERVDDLSELCLGDKGWRDAEVRFWYRKFYRETVTGQLMVLRSDEPLLFHYPEGELVRRVYSREQDTDVLARIEAALSAVLGRE
jgi:hypothetical protein